VAPVFVFVDAGVFGETCGEVLTEPSDVETHRRLRGGWEFLRTRSASAGPRSSHRLRFPRNPRGLPRSRFGFPSRIHRSSEIITPSSWLNLKRCRSFVPSPSFAINPREPGASHDARTSLETIAPASPVAWGDVCGTVDRRMPTDSRPPEICQFHRSQFHCKDFHRN
jgi:hypothetical protein